MTPSDLIEDFVEAFRSTLESLPSWFPEVSQETTDLLMGAYRRKVIPKDGRREGFGTWSFHGAGLRLERQSGEVVDFDWVDRREAFDAWRVRHYARSVGLDTEEGQIRAALPRVAGDLGLAEIRPGWYALQEGSE